MCQLPSWKFRIIFFEDEENPGLQWINTYKYYILKWTNFNENYIETLLTLNLETETRAPNSVYVFAPCKYCNGIILIDYYRSENNITDILWLHLKI